MIQFSLHCSNGHQFEAWFRSTLAFEEQQARGIVTCGVCGDGAVEKSLMAPAVARSSEKAMSLTKGHPDLRHMQVLLREYHHKITSTADNVGTKFAEEARKIHFEEVEPRGIYGQATREEVVDLLEDGVDFMPLPDLPDEHN